MDAKMYSTHPLTLLRGVCSYNSLVASTHGLSDVLQSWNVVSLIADDNMEAPQEADGGAPWAMHPFGRHLLDTL